MKTLAFTLRMPNVGSWNGAWSGSSKLYVRFRRVADEKAQEIAGQNYYYNFGDGWGASVDVQIVDSTERQRLQRKSAGFCSYDWMIDSIVANGKIVA